MCITISSFFFFNDTATTEIYTLSLHDALPISRAPRARARRSRATEASVVQPALERAQVQREAHRAGHHGHLRAARRSEEHTSELQSPCNLVCRLLLEKKKKNHSHSVQLVPRKI